MKIILICALVVCSFAFAQTPVSLHGTVTDPSGALVPGALVQLRGPGPELRATSDDKGQYSFAALQPGKYTIRVIAKGFTVGQKQGFDIASPQTLDIQLTIEADSQVVNVEETAGQVTTDPGSNGDALVLHAKELEALSDDPDELAQQLQAMAGPASRSQRWTDLYRWIHRRQPASQILHPRNPHQFESLRARIRYARLRTN